MKRLMLLSVLFLIACQAAKKNEANTGTLFSITAETQVCQVTNADLIDSYLMQHAKTLLSSAGDTGNEIWSLLADTDGSVVFTELYDVLRTGITGVFAYRKEGINGVAQQETHVLNAEQLKSFQEKISSADKLCDLNNPSFGGTKYQYLHLSKNSSGEISVFAAFVAPNPEGAVSGSAHASAISIFTDLAKDFGIFY